MTALRGSSTFSCLCLSFTFSGVRVGWSQLCDPSCGSWVLNSSVARLRRPDALASGRTLSFYRRGFLPFPFPCPGFRWAVPAVWWSRLLLFSWNLTLGSSLSLPVFVVGLRWLGFILGCSTLRSLAVEVVTLVLCQVLVGLSSWLCCASGFLGPVVFLVFTFGHLSQVRSVLFLSQRS